MSEETNSNAEIKTPLGSIALSGKRLAEFVSVLSLSALLLVVYALWQHQAEAKEGIKELRSELKDDRQAFKEALGQVAEAIKAQSQATKFQNCILATPQDQRAQQFENPNSLCNRLSR